MINSCKYCKKQLERKLYPAGAYESDARFFTRIYCDLRCKGLSQSYESARNHYKVLKKERLDFISLKN